MLKIEVTDKLRALRTDLKRTRDSSTSEEAAAATPLAAFPAPVAAGLRLYMNGASGAMLTRGGGGNWDLHVGERLKYLWGEGCSTVGGRIVMHLERNNCVPRRRGPAVTRGGGAATAVMMASPVGQ